MKAPDSVWVAAQWHPRENKMGLYAFTSADDTSHPHKEKFIRLNALLGWLQKEYETNKWFYDTHAKPNELHTGRCEAYMNVINKLSEL